MGTFSIAEDQKRFGNAEYLEAMLNSELCKLQARNLTRGIANKDLVLGQMKGIRIMLPPVELQLEFAKVFEKVQFLCQKQVQSETNSKID
jgi:type I restriction enzyme S subunit